MKFSEGPRGYHKLTAVDSKEFFEVHALNNHKCQCDHLVTHFLEASYCFLSKMTLCPPAVLMFFIMSKLFKTVDGQVIFCVIPKTQSAEIRAI